MIFKLTPPRFAIWLLLLISLVKGVTWSIIIPPWHAPDENNHFEYAQMIERFRVLHPDPAMSRSEEIGLSWNIMQIPPMRARPNLILDFFDRKSIAEQINRLDDIAIKRGYIFNDAWFRSFRNFTHDHPPVYYLLASAIHGLLEDQSILVRILVNRWLSVFLGVLTVALAYRAGKEIWLNESWACLLATLVSFQPMLTFVTSVISDGALGITMLTACTALILRVIRLGWTVPRAGALALLVGLSLLSRSSLVILVPLLMLLFIWNGWVSPRERKFTPRALAPIASVLACALLMAGWWYKSNAFDNSDTRLNFFISGITGLHTSWRQTSSNYDWSGAFKPVLDMYWGFFGWLDTPFPQNLYMFLAGVTTVAVWTTLWWLMRLIFSSGQKTGSQQAFMLAILGIQTIFLIALYSYLDFRFFNIGGIYRPQGRYFMPAIIGQMTWLAIGLISPAPLSLRRVWMWLVAIGMMMLNIYSLFSVITLRYYGARNLWLVADRAAVFQPISADSILTLCVIFFLLAGVLVLALWHAFEKPMVRSEEFFN